MILTELEAKEKQCRVTPQGMKPLCAGSKCMHWVWTEDEYQHKYSKTPPEGEGWHLHPGYKGYSEANSHWRILLGDDRKGGCGLVNDTMTTMIRVRNV